MPQLTPPQIEARRRRKKRWYKNHRAGVASIPIPVRDVKSLWGELTEAARVSPKRRKTREYLGQVLGRIIEELREAKKLERVPFHNAGARLIVSAEPNQDPT